MFIFLFLIQVKVDIISWLPKRTTSLLSINHVHLAIRVGDVKGN